MIVLGASQFTAVPLHFEQAIRSSSRPLVQDTPKRPFFKARRPLREVHAVDSKHGPLVWALTFVFLVWAGFRAWALIPRW